VFPRQPGHDRICLADFYRPLSSGERDVAAIQAVTAGPKVTEVLKRLEDEGEFAEQLYVHGLGVQVAEGLAEWLHSEVRRELGIGPSQGRRYSWGYPACPDQSEHEKVFRLLDAPSIGLRLSGGYAVEPEQSTLAIVAHHPQAVYFGMKSGRLSENGSPDALIADPEGKSGHRIVDGEVTFDSLPDEEPPEEADMGDGGGETAASDGASADGSGDAYEESRAEAVADK
jgi:5-methyltetrahydrofolate--homocysteine methyltransferase